MWREPVGCQADLSKKHSRIRVMNPGITHRRGRAEVIVFLQTSFHRCPRNIDVSSRYSRPNEFRRVTVSGILGPCWRKSSMRKLLFASLIVLFTAAAVAHSAGLESTTEANKTIVKRAFAAMNEGDLNSLNELFDPDGAWHLPGGKTVPQGGPFSELAKSCPMRRAGTTQDRDRRHRR
jgi:hypothetical protein